MKALECCRLCPRDCRVNREKGEIGYCGADNDLYVARAALHFWEEPCLSGTKGSGTVFFSNCNLKCVYCQNYSISTKHFGKKITIHRLAEIFLELQEKGANNINLVTPTHYVPQIIEALKIAKENGLHLPIVYNTSGYEKIETLKMLEGYIDIYLPDFKYWSEDLAIRYSKAVNYKEIVKQAIKEMYRQVKDPVFDEDGRMKKGIIVRHLMLPGHLEDSKKIIDDLFSAYQHHIYLSIMNQYTPLKQVEHIKELNQTITEKEYEELLDYALDLGIKNAFIQEGETQKESFIPEFNTEGV